MRSLSGLVCAAIVLSGCGEGSIDGPLDLDGAVDLDRDPCAQGACEGTFTLFEATPAAGEATTTGEAIVAVAVAELGRGPTQVGIDLTTYPYDLGRYLAVGEAWCSEFVAWAFRVQGDQPFTGGTQGGWMLRSSSSIRQWFESRGRWLGRGSPEWSTFVPAPGDYVRYVWADGGSHSGIVRYAEGSTLYTVEGNVSNTVRLMTRSDYRNNTTIDGFGLLSDEAPPVLDTTPPTAPTNVQLAVEILTTRKGKRLRTITYVNASWSAATDNSGAVQHYAVNRNGALLATTTQLSYQDASTSAGATYTYTVIAVDAAGNVSAASEPVTLTR